MTLTTQISKWGVRIVALWSLALAFLAFAYILHLTNAVGLSSNELGDQPQVWTILVMNIVFCLGFLVCSYGLWFRHNWGRLSFLWVIGIWSGFNLVAVLDPGVLFTTSQNYTTTTLALNGLRFAATLLIPLWYLNRPQIKSIFVIPQPNEL